MLDPTGYAGLGGDIAREQAEVAWLARELRPGRISSPSLLIFAP